jgi:hypothetical protein
VLGSAGYFRRVLRPVLRHGTYAEYSRFFGVGVEQCRFLVRSVYLGGQYSAQ